jgi:hypothetical protein
MTTTTGRSAAPPSLLNRLQSTSREDAVLDHAETVDLDWWNADHADLPGLPVTAAGRRAGRPKLSRREIFTLAEDAVTDQTGTGALRLLWHACPWGTGTNQRGNDKRIVGVMANPDERAQLLLKALRLSRTDPAAAFALLRPGRGNTIKGIGPGFFTKFLYFAGGGDPDHPCAIVDSAVRRTQDLETGRTNPRLRIKYNYSLADYLASLEILEAWADAAAAALGPDRCPRRGREVGVPPVARGAAPSKSGATTRR